MQLVHISRLIQARLFATAAAAIMLASCAASPIRVAQTLEQRAYAAYGTFVIIEEQVVKLTGPQSTLTRDVQLRLISGVERAQPAVDSLLIALQEYETARADFEAQRIDQPAFQVVVNNLSSWVTTAEPLVTSLLAAIRPERRFP